MPTERPRDPRITWGIRIALLIGIAFTIALETGREAPRPIKPPSSADSETATSTNAPLVAAGFDRLGAFPVEMPRLLEDAQGMYFHAEDSIISQVPPEIRGLDGRRVVVTGFMQPITLNKGKVNEFLLLRDRDTCCFGGRPEINHWIGIKLTNGITEAKLGRPVHVRGVLNVREIRTDGILVGLYTMEADAVVTAEYEESGQ